MALTITTPQYFVYVLEDESQIINVIRGFLITRPEIVVRSFTHLEPLLADANLAHADLFILDINLDDTLSGFDVPDRLPMRCRFAGFLFISGYPVESEQYNRAAGLPLFDFIAKPFTMQQFKHRVDLLLAARFKIPPGLNDRLIAQWARESFLSVVLDADNNVRLCNRHLALALGVKHVDEIIGRPWAELIPIIDRPPDPAADADEAPRLRWVRSDFESVDGAPMTLLLGVYTDAKDLRAERLRRFYQEILQADRAAIQSIQPLPRIDTPVRKPKKDAP